MFHRHSRRHVGGLRDHDSRDSDPYPLKQRFLVVVVPLLGVALAGLLAALSQALAISAEHAYVSQAAAWHRTLLATAEQADPAAWTRRSQTGSGDELADASLVVIGEASEMGWSCAVILDHKRTVVAQTPDRSCITPGLTALQVAEPGQPAFKELDGPPARWLVVTTTRTRTDDLSYIVLTSESSTRHESALSSETVLWLVGVGAAFVCSIGGGILLVFRAQEEIDGRTESLAAARAALARFVSGNTNRRALSGSGEPRQLLATVMFLDIRDFSSFAEAYPPDVAVDLISRVAEIGFDAVLSFGGEVDRLLGDGLIAWFEGEDRRRNAWLTASKITAAIRRADLPRGVGIGMHDGTMIEAEIGAGERKDATVFGNSVNIAARLCSRAGPGEVLASPQMGMPTDDTLLQRAGTVAVRTTAQIDVVAGVFKTFCCEDVQKL